MLFAPAPPAFEIPSTVAFAVATAFPLTGSGRASFVTFDEPINEGARAIEDPVGVAEADEGGGAGEARGGGADGERRGAEVAEERGRSAVAGAGDGWRTTAGDGGGRLASALTPVAVGLTEDAARMGRKAEVGVGDAAMGMDAGLGTGDGRAVGVGARGAGPAVVVSGLRESSIIGAGAGGEGSGVVVVREERVAGPGVGAVTTSAEVDKGRGTGPNDGDVSPAQRIRASRRCSCVPVAHSCASGCTPGPLLGTRDCDGDLDLVIDADATGRVDAETPTGGMRLEERGVDAEWAKMAWRGALVVDC